MSSSEVNPEAPATTTGMPVGRATNVPGDVSVAEASPVALLRADVTGRVDFANAAWRDLWAVDPADLQGHGWLALLTPEGGAKLLTLLERAAPDGEVRSSDQRLRSEHAWRWTRWSIKRAGDGDCVVLAVTDVHEDLAEREALRFRALHDPLTGLVNRAQLIDLTGHALRGHVRHPALLAMLFVDLDGFKAVNDAHGHALGDRVLVEVSTVMRAAVRPEDVLSRIGGDEFAVLCDGLERPADVIAIAERVRGALEGLTTVDGVALSLSASLGVAYADGAHEAPEAILDRADQAMYREKRRRVCDVHDWSPSST